MDFQRKMTIEGFAHFDGSVDGKEIDSLKIYALETIKGSEVTTVRGCRTVEYKMRNAKHIAAELAAYDYPIEAELTFEVQSAKGKNGEHIPELVVTDVHPLTAIGKNGKATPAVSAPKAAAA
mgnify:CR=1 FL=1